MTGSPGWAGPRPEGNRVELVVLGSTGSRVTDPDAEPGSGYLVWSGACAVLVDAGPGVARSLARLVPEVALDALIVTHRHSDHLEGWSEVVEGPWWHGGTRLIAPRDVGERVFDPTGRAWTAVADGDTLELAGARVRFSRTDHPVETVACGLEIGSRRLVYSADTGPAWRAPASFAAPDVLLVECTLAVRAAGDAPHHLDGAEAAALARGLGARRVLLCHGPPGADRDARVRAAHREWPEGHYGVVEVGWRSTV